MPLSLAVSSCARRLLLFLLLLPPPPLLPFLLQSSSSPSPSSPPSLPPPPPRCPSWRQAEHLYYQHESIARAVHKAQAFTNKFGKAEDLHPACTVSSASARSDGKLDVSKGHPAAFLGQPVVDHEDVRETLELLL